MSAYTDGPWRIEDAGHRGSDGPTGFRILPVSMRYVVAETFDYGPEGEANARLIAAAPDLLEALVTLASVSALWYDGATHPAHEQARAAIAKARGQAS